MLNVASEATSPTELLMGNSAFARGCLEAGIGFATAYPGSPSSEILEELGKVADEMGIYAEWSTNEKVAVEVAAAAALSGVRAVSIMKQNGLNVSSDYIMTANGCGTAAGLVVIVCDDPNAYSSNNEQDPRPFAKWGNIPLLEPMDFQETKDMTKWAFDLSEELGGMVFIRGQTRICHARGNVKLGELARVKYQPRFDLSSPRVASARVACMQHQGVLDRVKKAEEVFESSPFNSYAGPETPELLVITSGICWLYTMEAVKTLGLEGSVGILRLGTIWPPPRRLIKKHLSQVKEVLFVEQVDPFIEDNIKELVADWAAEIRPVTFYGKRSGHINSVGELNATIVIKALAQTMGVEYMPREASYEKNAQEMIESLVPPRALAFCPGCPHRATFWTIKNALKLIGGDGFATGDIGCYALGAWETGYSQLKTVQAMGSGAGISSGFGKLGQLGFDQPVLAVCGDSTFYHATIPALINAVYNQSNFTMMVLDNSATAMTGFQPHPGTGKTATNSEAPVVDIEAICRSLGVRVEVADPFALEESRGKLMGLMEQAGGVRVLIMRRKCELIRAREEEAPYARVYVDPEKCYGETCGCNRLCTRVFKCPGLRWNKETKKAEVDEAICVKCGVCYDICPQSAIVREAA